jgi:hypothetical protein
MACPFGAHHRFLGVQAGSNASVHHLQNEKPQRLLRMAVAQDGPNVCQDASQLGRVVARCRFAVNDLFDVVLNVVHDYFSLRLSVTASLYAAQSTLPVPQRKP